MTLSRLVNDRVNLSISHYLRDKYPLSIIQRCYEDQLRLNYDDFLSNSDLHVACMILEKESKYIDGNKDNIIIPHMYMNKLQEQNGTITAYSMKNTNSTFGTQSSDTKSNKIPSIYFYTSTCTQCIIDQKRLIFIPCHHGTLRLCCGHTLKQCPQ
ncbi:unnamed protein product, partial [Didymodactylos carnosus]